MMVTPQKLVKALRIFCWCSFSGNADSQYVCFSQCADFLKIPSRHVIRHKKHSAWNSNVSLMWLLHTLKSLKWHLAFLLIKNISIYEYANVFNIRCLTAGYKMSTALLKSILSVCALQPSSFHITLPD